MSDRGRGILVIAESLLIFVPLVVLGAAIEWPASLGDPAEVALPRLLEHEAAVRFGYLTYLAYSVLFLPVAIVITRWMRRERGGSSTSTITLVAVGAAAASAALRSIGIVRWLAAMFPLAQAWSIADPAGRTVIAGQFHALNDYGGAIGEALGVSLFAAIWLGTTTLGSGARGRRWLVRTGAAATVLVALPLAELAGVPAESAGGLVTIGSTAISLWLLGTGVAMVRSSSRTAQAPDKPRDAAVGAAAPGSASSTG